MVTATAKCDDFFSAQSNLKNRSDIIRAQRGSQEDKEAFVKKQKKHAQYANGVIEFIDGKAVLKPFSPHYYSVSASPISYDPKATCPQFLKMLRHVPWRTRKVIQRAFGQIFLGSNLTQRIFIFEGLGNSGKSG